MENRRSILPTFEPGSRLEALAAMPLFLLGVLTSLLNLLHALNIGIPMWVGTGLGLVVLITFIIGLIRGLPRWSLPYTGVIGLTLSWILTHRGTFMGLDTRAGLLDPLLGWTDRLFHTVMRTSPWIVRVVVGTGWDWVVLLGLTAIGVLIVAACQAVILPLRPLYARIRDDWTLLSFGLYGSAMMAVSYTFEDYPSAKYPFMIVSFLILAAGAWMYIRSGRASGQVNHSQRALPLFAAMVLTMILGATGKALIHAGTGWPHSHWPYYDTAPWYRVVLNTALLWGWVMVVVLAPALLTLLPRPPQERVGTTRHDLKGSYTTG